MNREIERYRRWFEYEMDAHNKVLASLESVPSTLRRHPSYQKAIDLMAHIVKARWLWLARLGAADGSHRDMFPQAISLTDVILRVHEMHEVWSDFLLRLTDDDRARSLEYQSLEGPWFKNTIEDILTQMFGHSWYHRGQIAAHLRTIGAEPSATDFILWARQPIDPPH